MDYRFESTLSVTGPFAAQSRENDGRLIDAVMQGDRAAFTSLFECHNERIFLYCARVLGDAARGEDVAQEVWVRLIRLARRRRKKAIRHPLPFLYRIARNLCLNALRDGRRLEVRDHQELESLQAERITPGAGREEILRHALSLIPLKYREVLVLNAWSGYDFAEIGVMLGISKEAAWKRASRGRRLLKEMIEREEKGESS